MPDKSEAYLNGWHAHRLDRVTGENPYSEELTAFSYMQWLDGWCARFAAVKHGHRLEFDETL